MMRTLRILLLLVFFLPVALLSQERLSDRMTIKSNRVALKAEIYPNPVQSAFRLRLNQPVQEVRIYNFVGQLEWKHPYRPHARYDVTNLPKGLYLIQFIDASGKSVLTRRLKKE